MILDTNILIDLMRNDNATVKKLDSIRSTLSVSTPTLFELQSGIARSERPQKEQTKVQEVLNDLNIQTLDASAAREAGRIHGELKKQGQSISAMDALIAGITLTNKEVLLTRNVKDFQKVEGLVIESY